MLKEFEVGKSYRLINPETKNNFLDVGGKLKWHDGKSRKCTNFTAADRSAKFEDIPCGYWDYSNIMNLFEEALEVQVRMDMLPILKY